MRVCVRACSDDVSGIRGTRCRSRYDVYQSLSQNTRLLITTHIKIIRQDGATKMLTLHLTV